MPYRSFICIALLTLSLSGCATQTPYQPAEKRGAEGYTETKLGDTRYRITFTGNSTTPAETVKDYALLRAGELTLEKGSDWFQLVDSSNDKKVQTSTTVDSGLGIAPATEVYQRCGLLRCSTVVTTSPGYGSGFDVGTTTTSSSYTSSLEIVMGKKPMPNKVESYDARDLVTSLRGIMGKNK